MIVAQSECLAAESDPRAMQAAAQGGSGSSPASTPSQGAGEAGDSKKAPEAPIERRSPWFIILNTPQDLDELWRKIERPDLVLSRADRFDGPASSVNARGKGGQPSRSVIESVKITGRVLGENADLSVEFSIAVQGAGPVWVPIRLDNKRVARAREGAQDLSVRAGERGEWEVSLAGEGKHVIRVDLRAGVSTELARKKLLLPIPEAQVTRVELNFVRRESDIVIGADEDFGQTELGEGKGSLLAAYLSPRSKLEVSWSESADSLGQTPPLLTAQSEIAIDIDAQQMRTRSSWSIRCVRGVAKSLELQVDDAEEITELELDDQSLEDDLEQARGPGKLTIPLNDPIRAGESRRLVLRTRRSLAKSGTRRISFAGFPLSGAREQSGFIGITRSPNLYIGASTPQGVYRIDASKLPADLRARPSTSLAYEFPNQPFILNLMVEPSPPQVRGEIRTFFQIEPDKARSETTIDLSWVRGDLFELEIGVAPGMRLISVGPADSVESTNLTLNRLNVRLTPRARDRNKAALKLTAVEPISALGPNKLGVFSLDQGVATTATFALQAGRGLSLEVLDDTGRLRRAPEIASRFQNSEVDLLAGFPVKSAASGPLYLVDEGNSTSLPVRIAYQERRLHHEATLTAKISPRSVDVVERVAFSVRHGALRSLDIRVPAEFVDRWEVVDRQEVDIDERGRERDGSANYRLSFARPVVDQGAVRFRYRFPLSPALDSRSAREVTIPRITIKEGEAGPSRVLLELSPEIVVEDSAPGWVRAPEDAGIEPGLLGPYIQLSEGRVGERGRPFAFKARALEKVTLPSLVVPRLLIKTIRGTDGKARTSARYWVESHGADFPFALPKGVDWIEARVDGRIAERVDFDQSKSEYRLRFPGDAASKPALVELDIEEAALGSSGSWRIPELLEGGVVLQTLWEVRLPWSVALLGIPRGWCDENQWFWSGFSWKRGAGKESAGLNQWLLGAGAPASAIDDFGGSRADLSDRYVFSRRGRPTELSAWIVPEPFLIGICSGLMLIIGFLAIFLKIRFRSIWLGAAAAAVLAAVLVEPTVMLLALQAAALGAVLTLVGLLIERSIEHSSAQRSPVARGAGAAIRPATDSSLNRSAGVGSNDSTAIRVRVPSTLDHAPAAIAAPEARPEVRSSTVQRA